ncbi:PQQ-binding-like beta-propeller repeat protein [Crateriforma conspicua]|nr:PQQ-binding-like beta-propeller repeat protein [Crateriforma conspicua]
MIDLPARPYRCTVALMIAGCLFGPPTVVVAQTANRHFVSSEVSWPTKSGPTADGTVPTTMAGQIPRMWDWENGQGIDWTTSLEHGGHSTPVVGSGRIWLTSATDDGTQQFVTAIDAASGKVVHHRMLFQNDAPEPLGNPVNNYAAPTPFLESDAVYVHFGTYGTARLDPISGATVWQRRDINVRHFRGPGSSPVVVGDLVILTFDGIDRQFVTALDKHTGRTVWTTPRSTDFGDLDDDGRPLRDGDLRKAFGTPAVFRRGDQTQIVSVGSRAAFGYDAETGEEIWTVRHDDYNASAQPLVFRDTVIINTGSRGAELMAIRIDASTVGDVTDTHVVWNHDRGNARLSYPVLCNDMVIWITDSGVATAVDAAEGFELWKHRIGGNYVASPLVDDDTVYFFNSDGQCVIAKVDHDGLTEQRRNTIGESMTASPAVSGDGLILRAGKTLAKIAVH